jgi:hypothetical protein
VAPTAERVDPYKNFRFQLKWNGVCVAGISKVSGLARENGTAAGAVTLARGVSHDPNFEQWVSKASDFTNMNPLPASFRRNMLLDCCDETGQIVASYNIKQCWPSELHASTDLDGVGDAMMIETLVLQHEGWEPNPSTPPSA